ncbi:MAG: 3-dehydroquinate synthase, partial [Planctomycetota bacterium]
MPQRSVHVAVPGATYDVEVGGGASLRAASWLGSLAQTPDRVAVVADERVVELHGALDLSSAGVPGGESETLTLPGGEAIKTFRVLEDVLDFCSGAKLSRGSVLIAYGGGTIGDLA